MKRLHPFSTLLIRLSEAVVVVAGLATLLAVIGANR
jgi:hypothetical protein